MQIRRPGILINLLVSGALLFTTASLAAETNTGSPGAQIKIVLVGDSTVTDRAGWGQGFKQFLNDRAVCVNTAQGGRSSMSFMKEGRWTNALALQADYYLIQFGHNNEPGKPGRSTDMATFIRDMNRYVDDTRASGAQPILVTPLARRQWDKANPGKIKSSLAPYADEVRAIAREKMVPLVDLHARSIALCEKLGPEACLSFSPLKRVDGTNTVDGTHLNAQGSLLFARLVVEELRKTVPRLARVFRAEPVPLPLEASRPAHDITVAADGSGNYTTIQSAVDAAPQNRTEPFVILLKPGTYKEHLVVPADKPFLTLRGEETAVATIITDARNVNSLGPDGQKLSTPDSATVLVRAANFTAENVTFENTTTRADKVQALALYVTGDRAVFRKCRFLGWQDTLRPDAPPGEIARQFFTDCEIAGHVDFIYAAGTAVFQRCHIRCLADGYITAASTSESNPFGYVFLDCRITAAPGVKRLYLGRPWRPFAATAFLRTEMPAQIAPEGWHNWGKAEDEKTARYAEFQNTGPGANPAARVPWAKQLTDQEARLYTVENILRGSDDWNPNN